MRRIILLLIIPLLFSCRTDPPHRPVRDGPSAPKDAGRRGSTPSTESPLWGVVDAVNKELSQLEHPAPEGVLERLFQESVELSTSSELGEEFEKLRAEAFESHDDSRLGRYVRRCEPAITVAVLGESNNIGVNVDSFIGKCPSQAACYRLFMLAKDGFYSDNATCRLGTSEFPQWIERTESSSQGRYRKERVSAYLEKWKSVRQDQKGYFREVAEATVRCLEKIDR